MSQENVDLVRAGFEAFERGDMTALFDMLADDLVVYRADPDDTTYHGKEGFLTATVDWTEGFSEWEVVPKTFTDAGHFVIAHVRQIARGEASGVPLDSPWWFLFEVRDGTVRRLSFYSREADALEAAGLDP
jgi:ketosteroid isomerase-like protein